MFFRELYYWLLNPNIRIYKIDYRLNILLIYLKDIGIENVSYQEHSLSIFKYFIIKFKDGTILKFEDRTIYMCTGNIKFSNGKEIIWNFRQPSNEVMFKIKKIIKNHNKNFNYSEYLPLKTQRKIKLKNLK